MFGSKVKAHFFPNLFSFETQRCSLSRKSCAWRLELNKFEKKKRTLTSEQNNFMQIIESNKVRLEFKPHIIEFWTPCDAHSWLDSHCWGSNYILKFFASMHPVISIDWKFLILYHKWESPHLWRVFLYQGLRRSFSMSGWCHTIRRGHKYSIHCGKILQMALRLIMSTYYYYCVCKKYSAKVAADKMWRNLNKCFSGKCHELRDHKR